MYRLVCDNDAHWYVIHVREEPEFLRWVDATERNLDWEGKVFDLCRVDGPHSIVFPTWQEETDGEEDSGVEKMGIRLWYPGMPDKETKDLAYWERNVLALRYADGWYNDDVTFEEPVPGGTQDILRPRYEGWRRVLSLEDGAITFHIPDNFKVGNLPEIKPNWDGHTTEEKWLRILQDRGIES
jgi:hypothetical protein